jgi:hypothetical protein
MKLLDYTFGILYQQINKTNKSIPEWSSIILISTVQLINLLTVLIYFNIDLPKVSKAKFFIGAFGLLFINWILFLYKGRYKSILKNLANRMTWFRRFLVFSYIILSIFAFFWTRQNLYIPILITAFISLIILFQRKSFWKD